MEEVAEGQLLKSLKDDCLGGMVLSALVLALTKRQVPSQYCSIIKFLSDSLIGGDIGSVLSIM